MQNDLKAGRYRHFKGGEYLLLCTALHTESLEPLVIYKALYGEEKIWARPASMWNGYVEHDGKRVRRFEYIGKE